MLDEVVMTMQRLDSREQTVLPKECIVKWMNNDEIQVMGAANYILFDKRYYPKIEPPLTLQEYVPFVQRYYERCFRENPKLEWCDSMYTAGWDLVGWFMGLWRDPHTPQTTLKEIKDWIASLLRTADEQLRTCLITATLEHLFEDRKVAMFFDDWRGDQTLTTAYTDALLWRKHGGRSHFGKKPRAG
jgi:hypothetical protein